MESAVGESNLDGEAVEVKNVVVESSDVKLAVSNTTPETRRDSAPPVSGFSVNHGVVYFISVGFALILIAGSCCLFGFTIKFLAADEGKGGSCATTTGHAIWVYVIVRLVVGCCTSSLSQNNLHNMEIDYEVRRCYLVFYVVTLLGMLIYGGVVLFNSDVCPQFKNTGLYQMYTVVYVIDVVGLLFVIAFFIYSNKENCCDFGRQELTNEQATKVKFMGSCPICGLDKFASAKMLAYHLDNKHSLSERQAAGIQPHAS